MVGERKKGEEKEKKYSRRSDCRNSMVQELKSVHAMRSTRGYQNQ